jgi:hypothetical protein
MTDLFEATFRSLSVEASCRRRVRERLGFFFLASLPRMLPPAQSALENVDVVHKHATPGCDNAPVSSWVVCATAVDAGKRMLFHNSWQT